MMEDPQREMFELQEAIRLLQATPASLRTLLEGLPEDWLHFQEDPQAWSPRTVLVHFIHNERTNWMTRARVILSDQEARKFPPFQQLPMEGEFADQPITQLLGQFALHQIAKTLAKRYTESVGPWRPNLAILGL
jgi:hypothetical protein